MGLIAIDLFSVDGVEFVAHYGNGRLAGVSDADGDVWFEETDHPELWAEARKL